MFATPPSSTLTMCGSVDPIVAEVHQNGRCVPRVDRVPGQIVQAEVVVDVEVRPVLGPPRDNPEKWREKGRLATLDDVHRFENLDTFIP